MVIEKWRVRGPRELRPNSWASADGPELAPDPGPAASFRPAQAWSPVATPAGSSMRVRSSHFFVLGLSRLLCRAIRRCRKGRHEAVISEVMWRAAQDTS